VTKREVLLDEIQDAPEPLLDEILGFVRLLKKDPLDEGLQLAAASEHVLGRDWFLPEEDDAWRDL
jgi:hypothetical protein